MAEFNTQQYWHQRLGTVHHHFPISLDQYSLLPQQQEYHQQGSASVDADHHIASSSSSPHASEKAGSVRRSRKKKTSGNGEVVHVRARRGQATDSHSVAERVRREKINNKLRCLQELVPGCHKSMGMAVMLEEIINYVYSLQNQVEFLSMELAASAGGANGYFHNMNLEPQPPIIRSNAQLQANNSAEVKSTGEEYGDASYFQSTTTSATTTTWSI